MMQEQLKNIIPFILYQKYNNENIIVVTPQNFIFSLFLLKEHISFQFKMLTCISGVDLLDQKYRFSVVYDLLSLKFNARIRVKVFVNEITPVQSLYPLYVNSNWWEREVWDLFGIYFEGHPDLRRILTDYGFEGHPLRKDFPLSGYVESRYNDKLKRVVCESIDHAQEFRNFDFTSSWSLK
jgi:NADH/F420H2 dehydrogenase subunit C